MARASSGGSGTWIHWQTFNVGGWIFTRTRQSWKDSTAPWLSACLDTNTLAKCICPRTKDLPNGLAASHCGLSPKWRSHPLDWQKTRWSYQRKGCLFQACNLFQQTCQGLWKMDPLLGGSELSLHPANLKVEGKEPQMRSSLKEPHQEKTLPSPMNWFGIICTTAPSVALFVRNFLSCLSTPSCRPSHSPSHSSRSQGFSSSMWYTGGLVSIPSSKTQHLP